ncbi:MAG: family 10 glycosylhydrolase, partial [Cyclobacteriaceae bacterium]
PFGIYKNGVPAGIVGLNSYDVIYADPLNWLENHYVDYLAPQLYWKIGGQQDFKKLLEWWSEQTKESGRHLYAGHSLTDISAGARFSGSEMYSISILEDAYDLSDLEMSQARTMSQTVQEVPNQIAIIRDNRDNFALGSIFFRADFLAANPAGFTDNLIENTFVRHAVPPFMPWKQGEKLAAPVDLHIDQNGLVADYEISWERNEDNGHSFKRYLLFKSDDPIEEVISGTLLAMTVNEQFTIPYEEVPIGDSWWIVVELGLNNEPGEISNVVKFEKAVPYPAAPTITLPVRKDVVTPYLWIRYEWTLNEVVEVLQFHYQWANDDQFLSLIENVEDLPATSSARLFSSLQPGTYYFRIRAKNEAGWGEWTETHSATIDPPVTSLPYSEHVHGIQLYPNPTVDRAFLELDLVKSTNVSYQLMRVDGKMFFENHMGNLGFGNHVIEVKKEALGEGIFILQLIADDFQWVQKLIIN